MAQPKRKDPYVLQTGKHRGFDEQTGERRTFLPGEVVQLTPSAYTSFKDKFKPLAMVKAEAELAARQIEIAREYEAEQARLEATRLKFDTAKASEASEASGTSVEAPTPVEAPKVQPETPTSAPTEPVPSPQASSVTQPAKK